MFESYEKYSSPTLKGVRLPSISIEPRHYSELGVSPEISNYDFLRRLCWKGIQEKGIDKLPNAAEYYARVKRELETFEELGFVSYVLLNWEVHTFCIENKIPKGYGRGSCSGSLVLYLLQVTDVDPIKYDLFFERFVSKSRAKKIIGDDGVVYLDGSLLADVDSDISYDRRQEVIKFIEEKHKGRTSKILTVGTLSSKLVLRECGKIVDGLNEDEVGYISDNVPKEFNIPVDIKGALEQSDKLKSAAAKYPKTFQIAKKLEGLIKNTGVHASGIAICSANIEEIMPVQTTKEGEIVSGYEMGDVASLAVKFDILGLKTLTVVDDCCKQLGITMKDLDPNDEKEYWPLQNLIAPQGLFQIETDATFRICQNVRPQNIQQLSAVVSLSRPGASAYADQYAKFVQTGEFQSLHPYLDDVFGKTAGISCYQEQTLRALNKIGFDLETCETIRRCVTGDTRFLSKSRGWIKIETLLRDGYKNDLFLIMNENGEQTWKPIKDIWSNGIRQIRYVESQSGMTVKATQYHQFLTDKGWKARMRLKKEEDFLVSTFDVPETGTKSISDDWIIVLAGMMTEGYFVYGKCPTFTNFDKDVYERFLCAAKNVFGEKEVRPRKCGKVIGLTLKASKILAEKMKTGKSKSKDIPEIIFSQDKKSIAKFISFVLACEATIIEKELSITSASRPLLQKLQLLLTYFNVRSYFLKKTVPEYGEYWSLYISRAYNGKYIKSSLDNFGEYLQEYKKENLIKYIKNSESIESPSGATAEDIPTTLVYSLLDQYPFVASQCNSASGRIYKGETAGKTIHKNTFRDFCAASKDHKWIKISEGKQTYQKIESLEKDIREVEVFDFTIDEESPYIVANGLVIHNCIGKKLVNEMPQWEQKLRDKIKENNLDPKIGDVLWKVMSDSAKYSFAEVHAVAYSFLTFATFWLKFNHPKEFFLSLLRMSKFEQEPFEQISRIVQELPLFNLRLLNPDLAKSKEDFTIEGNAIRYGLNSIKGVSEKTLESLLSFRDKTFNNKYEIFCAAKDAGLSIGVLQTLIQAGCMDSFNTERCLLVLEARVFNDLTDKEKIKIIELGPRHNYNIIAALKEIGEGKLLNEKGKPVISPQRIKTLREKYKAHRQIYDQNHKHKEFTNWYFEKKLLGYSYSYTLRQVFEEPEHTFTPVLRAKSLDDGSEVKIVGVVTDCFKRKSKKGNNYLSVELSDETGRIRGMMGDTQKEKKLEKWLQTHKQPEEDQIVVLVGKKNKDTIFIDSLKIMDEIVAFSKKDLKE